MSLVCYAESVDPYEFASCRDALIALVEWRMAPVYASISFSRFKLGRSRPEQMDTAVSSVLIPSQSSGSNGDMELAEESGEAVSGSSGTPAYPQSLQVQSEESLVEEVLPMLLSLGHHLAASPRVFTQLCRLLKNRVTSFGTITSVGENEELQNIVQLLQDVLLPSLSQLDCNPALTTLCWSVLSLFPFQTRYSLYTSWKGDGVGKEVRGGCSSIDYVLLPYAHGNAITWIYSDRVWRRNLFQLCSPKLLICTAPRASSRDSQRKTPSRSVGS